MHHASSPELPQTGVQVFLKVFFFYHTTTIDCKKRCEMLQGTDAAPYDKKGPRRLTSLAVSTRLSTKLPHLCIPYVQLSVEERRKNDPLLKDLLHLMLLLWIESPFRQKLGWAPVNGLLQSLLATEG